MVAFDRSLIFIGRNRSADGKTGGYADAARQSDEVGMKITAIPRASVAGVEGVTAAPACARFVVAHSADHVIV